MLLQRQAISPRLRFHPALIACTIAITAGLVVGPQLMYSLRDTRPANAHEEIAVLEGSLFDAWHLAHPNAICPITTAQLSSELRLDPWGTPFRLTCRHHHIAVTSAGPDRRFHTADDIPEPSPMMTSVVVMTTWLALLTAYAVMLSRSAREP